MWTQRRLDVRYERANRAVGDRLLDPLGLVLKAGTWYLVARRRPTTAAGPRTYRVSRVLAAAVRDETFERPAGFDLEAFWADYQRGYAERVYRRDRGRPAVAGRARAAVPCRDDRGAAGAGRRCRRAGRRGLGRGPTCRSSRCATAHHALLQLGEHVEVLEPPELRERIAASARALVGSLAPTGGGARAGGAARLVDGPAPATRGRRPARGSSAGKSSRTVFRCLDIDLNRK